MGAFLQERMVSLGARVVGGQNMERYRDIYITPKQGMTIYVNGIIRWEGDMWLSIFIILFYW